MVFGNLIFSFQDFLYSKQIKTILIFFFVAMKVNIIIILSFYKKLHINNLIALSLKWFL